MFRISPSDKNPIMETVLDISPRGSSRISQDLTEDLKAPLPSASSEKVKVKVEVKEEPEQIIVGWEPNDPANPQNWSRARRWYITFVSSMLVLNVTLASSAPSGLMGELARHFSISREVGVLTISLFVAGFCVGPLLWGPLSEQYGRRIIFIISFFAYSCFQLGNALAKNTGSILVFRLLSGIFASAPLTNSGAIMSDIWDAGTRGNALALFTLAPFAGPALGPTISGYMAVAGVNWRWIFWLLTIFAYLCTALVILTLPETYSPILLVQKAERLRKETGDQRYIAPMEMTKISFVKRIENILIKPFRILISEPMLIAIATYMSFIYGCIYLLFGAYPVVFTIGHHYNPGVSGLMFLGIPIGGMLGVVVYLTVVNPRYRREVERHAPASVPPEARLEMALIGAPLFAISFFWFGWTSYPSISWVAPAFSGVVQGFAICFLFMSLINYIIDAYLRVAASALAASVVMRSLCGAAFPLFSTQMYEKLNPRWASTLLGFIALAMMPIPFVLIKYGPKLRRNSKYAPSHLGVLPQHVKTENVAKAMDLNTESSGKAASLSEGVIQPPTPTSPVPSVHTVPLPGMLRRPSQAPSLPAMEV